MQRQFKPETIITIEPIHLKGGVLMPAGVKLEFDKTGIAKYKNLDVHRASIPTQWVKGSKSIFLNARLATVLNDNRDFQAAIGKQYPPYCHVIPYGDKFFVYIWDSRLLIDVLDLTEFGKSKPIVKKLRNPETNQRIEKIVGQTKPWLTNLYKMLDWPQYACLDNGVRLVTDNKDLEKDLKELNSKA